MSLPPYSSVACPMKTPRQNLIPTLDGSCVVQSLGFMEEDTIRYYWITAAQLQSEIDALEEGWYLSGGVNRTPVAEGLDLYNAQLTKYRYVAE